MRLGELIEIRKGKKPSLVASESTRDFRRLIQIDDLRPGASLKYCPPATDEVVALKSDVLIAWDGANAGTSSFGLSGVIGSTLAVLRPTSTDILTPYLGHFLRAREGFLRSRCKGATVPHIDGRSLEGLDIPLPPLPEQRRIAEILDKVDALRSKRRTAIAQLDTLTQSIFLDMFGDPATNPKGWSRKQIADVATVITGNTPSRTMTKYYGHAIEWIKSDNINTPHYYLTRADEGLSEPGRQVARVAPAGSILVTCIAGSPECIGNAAMTDREVAFNQQINAVVPFEGNAHFVYAQLRVGKRLVQRASTAGMKGMVNKSRFERIALIWPPSELQGRFAERVEAVERAASGQRASLASSAALFASLQHRAFRGEL